MVWYTLLSANQHSGLEPPRLYLKIDCVSGSVLPAHRAVLVARCDVMAAMFSGKYAEARSRVVPIHGVSSDTFLSFLEYLYTDTCCPGGSTAAGQEQKQALCKGPTPGKHGLGLDMALKPGVAKPSFWRTIVPTLF